VVRLNLMKARRLSLILCFISTPVLAISDEANPWLALESAACTAHVMTDYTAAIGAPVVLQSAKWNGASNGLLTHCHVTGMLNGRAVDLRLPTVWSGQIYAPCGAETHSPKEALNEGHAVAFSPTKPNTYALLKAMALRHYPEAKTITLAANSTCN
jgi:hypothetical protein